MKENKVTKMVEQVVRTDYIAEDGTVFSSAEECRNYEESALFAVSKELKRLSPPDLHAEKFMANGYDDEPVEVFDIQTEQDLINLRKYLYLKGTKNGMREQDIQTCFHGEKRNEFDIDNITIGHEAIIFWNCDGDWFWTHRDGSIEGHLAWMRDHMWNALKPKEEKEN